MPEDVRKFLEELVALYTRSNRRNPFAKWAATYAILLLEHHNEL
jgi:hypothetical protein